MNRIGLWLVGFGLWLASDQREPWRKARFRFAGSWAVGQLNAIIFREAQAAELARRHAKPSSRKRVG